MSMNHEHDRNYEPSGLEIGIATDAALECLAWSEVDWDTETPLDSFGFDFTNSARDRMFTEMMGFIEANSDDLHGLDYSQIGHDFILTRNRHGAGFWDRGLGERGERLTEMTHPYGEIHAFILNGTLETE